MSSEVKKMAFTKQHLRALLLHLEQVIGFEETTGGVRSTCDNSLRRTEAFLRSLGVWSDEVREWLGEYGGFCDCEVLLNVGGRWEKRL